MRRVTVTREDNVFPTVDILSPISPAYTIAFDCDRACLVEVDRVGHHRSGSMESRLVYTRIHWLSKIDSRTCLMFGWFEAGAYPYLRISDRSYRNPSCDN